MGSNPTATASHQRKRRAAPRELAGVSRGGLISVSVGRSPRFTEVWPKPGPSHHGVSRSSLNGDDQGGGSLSIVASPPRPSRLRPGASRALDAWIDGRSHVEGGAAGGCTQGAGGGGALQAAHEPLRRTGSAREVSESSAKSKHEPSPLPRLTTLPQRRIRQSGHVEHEARGDPAFEDFLEALVDVLQSSCLGDDLGQAARVEGEAVGEVVAGTHQ